MADSSLIPLPRLKSNRQRDIKAPPPRSRYLGLMASRSFFIQTPDDARRHLDVVAKGLKKLGLAGWIGGGGCALLALLVTHYFGIHPAQADPASGPQAISGITLVTWFLAIAMLLFSTLYYVGGWALEKQKGWARYTAAATFLFKILLCVWIGRSSLASIIIFLMIASWDFYGLWVLLSKETGLLFQPAPSRAPGSYPSGAEVRQP